MTAALATGRGERAPPWTKKALGGRSAFSSLLKTRASTCAWAVCAERQSESHLPPPPSSTDLFLYPPRRRSFVGISLSQLTCFCTWASSSELERSCRHVPFSVSFFSISRRSRDKHLMRLFLSMSCLTTTISPHPPSRANKLARIVIYEIEICNDSFRTMLEKTFILLFYLQSTFVSGGGTLLQKGGTLIRRKKKGLPIATFLLDNFETHFFILGRLFRSVNKTSSGRSILRTFGFPAMQCLAHHCSGI